MRWTGPVVVAVLALIAAGGTYPRIASRHGILMVYAACLLLVDDQVSPVERLTAAQQRTGDSLGAGAYEMARLTDGETCFRRYGWEDNPDAPVIVLIHGGTIPSAVFVPIAAAGVQVDSPSSLPTSITHTLQDGYRMLTYDQYNRVPSTSHKSS